MMNSIMTTLIVNTAVFSVLFLLMLAARRRLMAKVSPVLMLALWAVVAFKLVIPFGFESRISLFPSAGADTAAVSAPVYDTAMPAVDTASSEANTATQQAATHEISDAPAQQAPSLPAIETVPAAAAQPVDWTAVALGIWGAGVLAAVMAFGLGAVGLKRRVRHAHLAVPNRVGRILGECRAALGIRRGVRVAVTEMQGSPLISGAARPVILLPESAAHLDDKALRHVILHELMHLRRGDLVIIRLMNVLCAVYWFNPLVWLCFRLIREDIETACDHSVIGAIGKDQRLLYIGTVLQFAGRPGAQRHAAAAMGMADGRPTMERRIRGIYRAAKTTMKGRITALALALLMLAVGVLTACQPTPDEPVVMNKNADLVEDVLATVDESDEAALEQDKQVIAEQIKQVNGHIDMEITPSDQVTIKVDADIVAPEYEKIPLVRVRPANLTSETFDKFADYLTGGQPLYVETWDGEYGNSYSKEEITDQVSLIKSYLANDDLPDNIRDAWEYRANNMQAAFDSAINQADEQPYDGTPIPAENNSTFSTITSLKCYMGKAKAAMLSLMQSFEGNETQMMFSNSDGVSGYNTHEPYEGADAPRIEMTYEQAKAKVMDFVHTVDGEDSNLVIYDSSIAYQINTLPDYTMETSPQAYAFRLARCYNGVAVKNVSYLFGFNETIEYSKRVSPESMMVVIDDSGIVEAYWSNYTEYIEDVANDVPLKDFDTIKGIFEDYCRYKFTWTYRNDALAGDTTPPVTLNVKKIELNVMVIPEKDNLENYITVPVWDFIADMTLEGDGMSQDGFIDEGQKNVSILTINAIDGTVIDRQQGY